MQNDTRIRRACFLALVIMGTVLAGRPAFSQGCSDAGVCTIGALRQEGPPDSLYLLRAGLAAGYGAGEEGVSVMQWMPEIELYLVRHLMVQLKMPFTFASGDLASTSGVGDLTATLTTSALRKEDMTLHVSAGVKLATGRTDLGDRGRDLPMPYQPGLGTHDLLIGIAWQYGTWHAGLGYQHVLSQRNRNGFTHLAWAFDAAATAYFESAGLERRDDAVVRTEKSFLFGKLRFTPGLLAIYHTGEDRIDTGDGMQVAVPGSDGITLNVTAALRYALSGRSALVLQGGSPVVVRDARPDGLTRALALNLLFTYGILK